MLYQASEGGLAAALTPDQDPAAHQQVELFPDSERRQPPLPPSPPGLASQVGGFGGRRRRYEVQRQAQLRWYDPIDQIYVTFSHDRYYLAWLIHRFDHRVRRLNAAPGHLAYQRAGRRFASTPHLEWYTENGQRTLLWLASVWQPDQRNHYETIQATHAASVVLMSQKDLDDQSTLLENLKDARQVMTVTAFAGIDLRPLSRVITTHMAWRIQCTRGELSAELCADQSEDFADRLDAALFHLHALGSLRLELAESPFGDDTCIRKA